MIRVSMPLVVWLLCMAVPLTLGYVAGRIRRGARRG